MKGPLTATATFPSRAQRVLQVLAVVDHEEEQVDWWRRIP